MRCLKTDRNHHLNRASVIESRAGIIVVRVSSHNSHGRGTFRCRNDCSETRGIDFSLPGNIRCPLFVYSP